ncbi:MAG: class I SAM-dependent methyltransferase [Longimicrobiales bacterium]
MTNDTLHLGAMSSDSPHHRPHDPWAAHYERVMALSFGELYEQMTQDTLAEVDRRTEADAIVLDLGAGAGRMAIPLAKSGRRVIAVERSSNMLAALRTRASGLTPAHAARIETRHASITNAGRIGPVDLTLCVFTVIAYCLTEAELADTFRTSFRALRSGGHLLLDVPDAEVFESMEIESADLIRDVSMTEVEPHVFEYREHTILRTPDGPVELRDSFRMRHWRLREVTTTLREVGFTSIEDVTDRFPGLGARYLIARKPNISSTER